MLEGKYKGERNECPEITFEEFKKIKEKWRQNSREAEKVVPGCLHLKVKDLQLLENKKWLNDEIISEYVSLLKEKIEESQNSPYSNQLKILNSLQVATFFDRKKYDQNKVAKFFERQKITQKSNIIMAIHKVNNWIFIKINKNHLLIYDSIYRSNIDEYLRFPTLSNIYDFAKTFYEEEPVIKSISDFPQQNNDYDCGMMMLCGIKDVVRNGLRWSFHQSEIPYRRVLIAK